MTPSTKKEIAPAPLLEWRPFPLGVLPSIPRTFVRETAAALGCDPALVAIPHLVALMSAVGNSHTVRLKRSWKEPAVMWGIIVGLSGTLKSPAFDAAIAPLDVLQDDAFQKHKEAMKVYKAAVAKAKEEKEDAPPKPICLRYLVRDVTVEALVAVLNEQPRGVLLARDELAAFVGSFDAFKKSRDSDRAAYLEMHRAGRVVVDRKSGENRLLEVRRAAVSITGTIQPSVLRSILNEQFFASGFPARCLLALPPARPKRWKDDDISLETSEKVSTLFKDLVDFKMEEGREGGLLPVEVALTPDAMEEWRTFFNAHNEEAEGLEEDERAAWSKIEGYTPRFALLLHLIREVCKETSINAIEGCDVRDAVILARWFGHETRRVYQALRENREQANRRKYIDLIARAGGIVTPRELRERVRRFKDDPKGVEAAKVVLDGLAAAGLGSWGLSEKPGPKVPRFTLHVHESTSLGAGQQPVVAQGTPSPSSADSETRGFVDITEMEKYARLEREAIQHEADSVEEAEEEV